MYGACKWYLLGYIWVLQALGMNEENTLNVGTDY
jgi:hypothetical protein